MSATAETAADDEGGIRRSTERYYRDILGLPDWSVRTRQRLRREFEREMFGRLCRHAGELQGKTVLDLGCGWGGVVLHAAETATSVVGIEPDPDRLAIAADLVARSGRTNAVVIDAIGEALPFPDGHFDVVASYQVLEHVTDPQRVIAEVHRVLRAGGVFHFNTPNYLSFREPHYKVLWLPLMPKRLARIYLRLRRRNPDFIDHIRYVHPIGVRRMLRQCGFEVTDVHETRVRAKLERWFRFAPRPLASLAAAPIRAMYLLFLNRDQEYVARKVGRA